MNGVLSAMPAQVASASSPPRKAAARSKAATSAGSSATSTTSARCLPPTFVRRLHAAVQAGFVDVDAHHVVAAARQHEQRRRADAARRAGDDGSAAMVHDGARAFRAGVVGRVIVSTPAAPAPPPPPSRATGGPRFRAPAHSRPECAARPGAARGSRWLRAALAATSAPKPATCTASCTTSSRPVLAAERTPRRWSHGHSVRRSITSALTPCRLSSVERLQRFADTARPGHDRQVARLRAARLARPSGTSRAVSTSPCRPHSSLCSR